MTVSPVLFSILIPAYNAQKTIEETVASVCNQTYQNWELVVVDDGSTDNTYEILASYAAQDNRIHVYSQENQGSGAAISTAGEHALGEFIACMGADDLLLPTHVEDVVAFAVKYPDFDIYASNAYMFFEDGSEELFYTGPNYKDIFSFTFEDLLTANNICGTAAVRRSVYEQIGGYNSEFFNEDYDFWLRALSHRARHIYQPKVLVRYRIHSGQKTGDAVRIREDDVKILQSLVISDMLTKEQQEYVRKIILTHQRNISIRKSMRKIFGPKLSEAIIKKIR